MVNCKRSKTIFVIPSSLTVGLAILILIVVTSCAIPIEKPTPYPAQSDQTSLITPTQDQTEPINTPTSQTEPGEELPELVETPEKEEPVEPEVTDQPTQTETKPVDLGQIKVWNWNNPEIFLTYDLAKWYDSGDGFSITSNSITNCFIAGNGFRDGPGWYENYDFETVIEVVGGIEYKLEKEILKTTGFPELTHVYWISQEGGWQNQLSLFTGSEKYEECVALFWEVMELSKAHNFSEVPGLAP